MQFEQIETNRLILKRLSPEDMSYIFDHFSKSEIMEILGHRSEEDYVKEANKHKSGYASYNRRFLLFLLIDKSSGQIIGRCGIHNWNKDHKRAEIGYVMEVEDFKKKGLMSEATAAIIDYGFRILKLNRIEAIVGTNNVPSWKIMEKNKFKKEGLMRRYFYINDQYEDAEFFSLLSDEYVYQIN